MMDPFFDLHNPVVCPYCKNTSITEVRCTGKHQAGISIRISLRRCFDCKKRWEIEYVATKVRLLEADPKLEGHVQEIPLPVVILRDVFEKEFKRVVPIALAIGEDSLGVIPLGYGDKESAEGYGCPVLFELCRDQLKLCVWRDILGTGQPQDNPEISSLEGARESLRHVAVLLTRPAPLPEGLIHLPTWEICKRQHVTGLTQERVIREMLKERRVSFTSDTTLTWDMNLVCDEEGNRYE